MNLQSQWRKPLTRGGHVHLSATKKGSDPITTNLENRNSLPPLWHGPASKGNLTAVFHTHVLSQKWDPRDPSLRTVDTDNQRALSAATYQTLAYALHVCTNPIPTAPEQVPLPPFSRQRNQGTGAEELAKGHPHTPQGGLHLDPGSWSGVGAQTLPRTPVLVRFAEQSL